MKKLLLLAVLAATAFCMTGCGSLRTPARGPNKGQTYYGTFFGFSIESGCYGDGFIVSGSTNNN